MNRTEFWILNGTSLLLAVLVIFEMHSSDQLEDAQNLARSAQIPILQTEELQPLARRMVQAVAQGSDRDPALKELLAKYGFEVTPPSPSTQGPSVPPAVSTSNRHAMSPVEKRYSPFWAVLIFFLVASIFDLDQTVKVHRQKLEVMQQYAQALKLRPRAEAQRKWILALREDLLRLAPGHPEASKIVSELDLRPAAAPPDPVLQPPPPPLH